MKIEGGCHCGRIRYQATIDPESVSICHCTDCQRLTGTAYRVSVRARREDLGLLAGSPRTYIKTGDSGAQRAQVFCPECGSPLYTYAVADPARVGIRVGSIDQRRDLVPARQIWCRSALDWAMDIRELPKSERE
jgi:hypothetical protein